MSALRSGSPSPTQIPLKAQGTETSQVGREFVLMDAAGRMLRGLNHTGARIWELIDGRRSLAEIAACVATEFQVSSELALDDVRPFVSALAQRQLLLLTEAAPASTGEAR